LIIFSISLVALLANSSMLLYSLRIIFVISLFLAPSFHCEVEEIEMILSKSNLLKSKT